MSLDTQVLTEADLKWQNSTPGERQEMVFEAALRVHNASRSIPQPLIPLLSHVSKLIDDEVSIYSESIGLEIWPLIASKRWELSMEENALEL